MLKIRLAATGDEAVVGQISHADVGPGRFGGEAFFVPAHEDPAHCSSASLPSCTVLLAC